MNPPFKADERRIFLFGNTLKMMVQSKRFKVNNAVLWMRYIEYGLIWFNMDDNRYFIRNPVKRRKGMIKTNSVENRVALNQDLCLGHSKIWFNTFWIWLKENLNHSIRSFKSIVNSIDGITYG